MLGIDTNVLVRFLVQDDPDQFEKARKLIRREIAAGRPVYINQLVLMETEWVMRSRYAASKIQIIESLTGLLEAADVQLEEEATIEEALYMWKDSNADFADCMIAAKNRRIGCRATATFDAKAAKLHGFVIA
jgi:predicted nucleic-acid-binding protein